MATQLSAWNAGNAAVLTGVLADTPPLVDAGGLVLAIGLALLAQGVRSGAPRDSGRGWWPPYGFRLLIFVLPVSIPIGLLLARLGTA